MSSQWAPYFYIYGLGSLVFFGGLFIAWRAGTITSKRIVFLLLGGLGLYAAGHALMQGIGAPGEAMVTGKAKGPKFIGTWQDALVVITYFVVIIGIGSYFSRFTRSSSDFFFGGRRFKGWLVAMSCVATTIGSYSFLKYSAVAFKFGFSSTMTYLNDWFWMPLWMLVWLPIIYYGRIRSVPEYFERRFGRNARNIATIILLVFLLGYISINFFTLGKAINTLAGWPVFTSAAIAAAVTSMYVAMGGQTSVIMTDLAQAGLLLFVGIGLFIAGVYHLGGLEAFWNGFPDTHRQGLAALNTPSAFHTMGIFWQDAMAGGIAFYFINQGVMMRFMSARNVQEGRKAIALVVLIVMPLAALSVSGAGWIGTAMVHDGTIDPMVDPDRMFIVVAQVLSMPGVFGLIMAALVAALMSTVDTLVTACSAVIVNDVYRPYFNQAGDDKKDLRVARIATVASSATALGLVPVFQNFDTIFEAHAAFVAAVVPPMAVALIVGICWRRFGQKAAVATMLGGSLAIAISIFFPEVIDPFAQGAQMGGEGFKAHKYMRAFYGLSISATIALIAGFAFKKEALKEEILVAGPEEAAKAAFKGSKPKKSGEQLTLKLIIVDEMLLEEGGDGDEVVVHLHHDDLEKLGAQIGDLVSIAAPGFWHGGLRSVHGKIASSAGKQSGALRFPKELQRYAGFDKCDEVIVTLEL